MVAAGDALGPDGPSGGAGRGGAVASLLLLAAYAIAASRNPAVEPWGLALSQGGAFLASTSLALGVGLGWAVPGLSLAFLTDRRLRGAALLGRSLALGVGYIVMTGLSYAVVTGHAPGRFVWLGLLAVPPGILCGKTLKRTGNGGQGDATLAWTVVAIVALTVICWPKLAHEGLNGDGTEAYEIARSLESHPLPHWDMERWEGPGRFGTPAVNPFVT